MSHFDTYWNITKHKPYEKSVLDHETYKKEEIGEVNKFFHQAHEKLEKLLPGAIEEQDFTDVSEFKISPIK
jgi:hypothetical protein